jgi:hypothetical protein
LHFNNGTTRANNAVVLLSTDGNGTLAINVSFDPPIPLGADVDFIIDINGWFE